MKHAFRTHNEIAREFINGIFDGSAKYCRNAHTDGRGFWSYSTNIARKVQTERPRPVVLLDSWDYSKTTKKQKNEIKAAARLAGIDVIECPYIWNTARHNANIDYFQGLWDKYAAKLNRARAPYMQGFWRSKMHEIEAARDLYRYYFGC